MALATDRVFSIAALVFSSSNYYGLVAAGGEISSDDPDPKVDALANNLAESSYITAVVFFFNLALAITY